MKTMLRIALVAAVVTFAVPAAAQVLNSSFNVTASVAKTCQFQAGAVADLAFGAYDPFTPVEVAGSTSFQFRCTNKTFYTIILGDGSNMLAGVRRMSTAFAGPPASTEYLEYQLDQVGAPWAAPWTSAAPKTGNATGNAWMTHTVFGRIPAAQQAAPGTYTDTVTITVNY